MTLINDDRDMRKLLDDLRLGEFSARDLQAIALTLPVSVLAAALYANAGDGTIVYADTHDKKADIIARLLHCWVLCPELRLGNLIAKSFWHSASSCLSLDTVVDGDLVRQVDAFVESYTQPKK